MNLEANILISVLQPRVVSTTFSNRPHIILNRADLLYIFYRDRGPYITDAWKWTRTVRAKAKHEAKSSKLAVHRFWKRSERPLGAGRVRRLTDKLHRRAGPGWWLPPRAANQTWNLPIGPFVHRAMTRTSVEMLEGCERVETGTSQ